MHPLGIMCTVASLLAIGGASPTSNHHNSNSVSDSLKPSHWLTPSELENTPSMRSLTMKELEKLPLPEGAQLMRKYYHIAQINHALSPRFVPNRKNISVYIIQNDGQKISSNLDDFIELAEQQPNFFVPEVTVFITGMPSKTETVKKANHKLIEAYIQRYNNKQQKPQNSKYSDEQTGSRTSSEENSGEWNKGATNASNLIVIDLGDALDNVERFVMLDVDQTGFMIGRVLVELNSLPDIKQEIIHIVAQGIAAHVAGAAGNEFTRLTGQKLRRITALDPSKILDKNPEILSGLSRGDADFVDAIHTSAYGMGTWNRVGDVDFFPNGPSDGVPGARNVIEATMRATRYYAESVRPGNEGNFPAGEAISFKQYQFNEGFGKLAFMGIATDFDIKGDYILEVNERSPFGKRTPVHKKTNRRRDQ